MLAERKGRRQVELDILETTPATAYIDGTQSGPLPVKKTVMAGFRVVRVELEDHSHTERWVPVFEDTILKMPVPKAQTAP